jgi:hypothetical protein
MIITILPYCHGKALSDIYPYKTANFFRERKEDTFSCNKKATERDTIPCVDPF